MALTPHRLQLQGLLRPALVLALLATPLAGLAHPDHHQPSPQGHPATQQDHDHQGAPQ